MSSTLIRNMTIQDINRLRRSLIREVEEQRAAIERDLAAITAMAPSLTRTVVWTRVIATPYPNGAVVAALRSHLFTSMSGRPAILLTDEASALLDAFFTDRIHALR